MCGICFNCWLNNIDHVRELWVDRYDLAKYLRDDEPPKECLDKLVSEEEPKIRLLLKNWRD